jgi:DNA transformation protein
MPSQLAELRNLGPATVRMLGEIDVTTVDALRALGAIEAYRRLKFRFGSHVTAVALYALEAALRDCHWLDLSEAERRALKLAARPRQAKPRPPV